MAPKQHPIIEIEKNQNNTLPSLYQAVTPIPAHFLGTALISNLRFEIKNS
jgi:hypothetical protein